MTRRTWRVTLLIMPQALPIVHVDLDRRGRWDVALPDPDRHVTCDTLDDARRFVYRRIAQRRPCELVVRDAYHRVVLREVVAAQPGGDAPVAGDTLH